LKHVAVGKAKTRVIDNEVKVLAITWVDQAESREGSEEGVREIQAV
jgi:hypothetical protein